MEEKIITMYKEGNSIREISRVLNNFDRKKISNILRIHNIEIKRQRHKRKIRDGKIKCWKCGKIKSVSEFPKHVSYCNACQKEHTRNYRKNLSIKKYLHLRQTLLRNSATRKHIPFSLPTNYLFELYKKQNGKCFYTDEELPKGFSKNLKFSLSVDRVNNENGYVRDNVVLCLGWVNRSKCNFDFEEIKKWMPLWYEKILNGGFV